MIKIPEGVEYSHVPVEKKYKSVTVALLKRILTIYKGIYEKFGQKGLDLIREVSENYGKEIAELGKKRVKIGDVKSVGLYLVRVFETINCQGEITEFSDDRVAIKLYQCPYPFDDPRICEAHTTMEEALVKSLGENLEYVITYSIPRGDPFCEHVVKKKKRD
jgi:predicted ArsR family transcriptional regulator